MTRENRTECQFSILIPTHDAGSCIESCLTSAINQSFPPDMFEVILIDDCSNDDTLDVAMSYPHKDNLHVIQTTTNSGPGIARNAGIEAARGKWILFLDSDDRLFPDALSSLYSLLLQEDDESFDAIGYDWAFIDSNADIIRPEQGMRKDHEYLLGSRDQLLKRYLSLQTDGSSIFTAVRRRLLEEHGLRFAPGIHEDVDYLFFVYWHAKGFRFVSRVLYGKVHRPGSIVNTVSEAHIHGFMRAWRAIGLFLIETLGSNWGTWKPFYRDGAIAILATRVREIHRLAGDESASTLYRSLYDQTLSLAQEMGMHLDTSSNTKYAILARGFLERMSIPEMSDDAKAVSVTSFTRDTLKKSWSCYDLHHSVYLAPDQIRTCCKRFFVDGDMRGDVVLLDIPAARQEPIDSNEILAAKQALYEAINRGDDTACDGCPFMQFAAWPPFTSLDLHYLSLEYHSVCNLRCSYCSDMYHGGKTAHYDIKELLNTFIRRDQLSQHGTVVWGGGEPVLDKSFSSMMEELVKVLPNACHRVLTNSVIYSDTIAELLAKGHVSVTTSVDAGSDDTFKIVRGRKCLTRVMENLKGYALLRPDRVTVKYIFTRDNSSLDEIRGFVNLVGQYGLGGCSYHISSNFKDDGVSVESAVLMIAMYGLLSRLGSEVIFFDDLLRHRLGVVHGASNDYIRDRLHEIGIESAIASSTEYPNVVVYGAGRQARYILDRSHFFQQSQLAFFVDDTPEKIGTTYMGHDVRDPSTLVHCDLPIIIAAVQGYPIIYRRMMENDISRSRIIKGLIV